MKYYSFVLYVNFADEFDTETLFIVNEKGLERVKKIVEDAKEKLDEESEFYFGSNEYVTTSEILYCFHRMDSMFNELTEDDVKSVLKTYGFKDLTVENHDNNGIVIARGLLDSVFDDMEDEIENSNDED